MAAVTVAEMRELENALFRQGISEDALMEKAGCALGRAIGIQFSSFSTAVAYIGKGHNAGDALIALRVLRDRFGWKVRVRAAYPVEDWAQLTRKAWDSLELSELDEKEISKPALLLDGLLGIGAKGALREPLAGLAREMEALRQTQGCTVAAVDLPSGVDPDTGEIFPGAVIADRTFLIGEAKRGLLSGGAANATGSLSLVHVEELSGEAGDREMICPQRMHFGKAPRAFDFHKGNAGRLGILAGSPEFTGAALIAATGALRAGGGLITLYSPKATCDAILARLPFEVMFKPCDDPRDLLLERLDALVVGPGLGDMSGKFSDGLLELISSTEVPMVIDADALNLIARNPVEMDERHVLTPHPGEFGRLAPGLDGMSREDAARKFVSTNGATLLLKGARTIVARRNEPLRFNSTGTPAMANGGQGDLLSGVIGAMLAQGMRHIDAASFGAWLCGHAAEIFTAENGSPSTAHDVSGRLGLAARAWRERSR